MTLDDIKARCVEQDGCWLWRGAMTNGFPKIFAPDHTNHAGEKTSQPGKRAVWHVKTGKAIPKGWRVFGTCGNKACCSPQHINCQPEKEWGRQIAESGAWKGDMRRIIANRVHSRARTKLTPELIQEITTSRETGAAVARRLNLSKQTVSKARQGKARAYEPVGGLFSGLLAANDSRTRAA